MLKDSQCQQPLLRAWCVFSAVEEVLDSRGAGRPLADFAVAEDDHAVNDAILQLAAAQLIIGRTEVPKSVRP